MLLEYKYTKRSKTYLIQVRLCGELGGCGLNDALKGVRAHRESTGKQSVLVFNIHAAASMEMNSFFLRSEADRGSLLLYEGVPVLCYKIPSKQVAGEATAHSADDQSQLLRLDDLSSQAGLQNPTETHAHEALYTQHKHSHSPHSLTRLYGVCPEWRPGPGACFVSLHPS